MRLIDQDSLNLQRIQNDYLEIWELNGKLIFYKILSLNLQTHTAIL